MPPMTALNETKMKMSFTGGHSPPAAPLHSSPPKSALCPQDKVRPNGANCTSPRATGLIMPSPRGALLLCSSDDDSGCVMDDFYAWVHHFFAALPPDKVPRIGTPGEQWRKRQLQRQLPPQDADARFCGNLSAKETCELEAFVRERREKALGRGEVRRLSPAAIGTSKLYCHQVN
uniref:PET domain-containing protein n=1 Tax=Globodera rostochiensis TaxID=31243 RepID=A0A914I8C2_GLORO